MDLIADHISHRFGALEVLDDVSFTVRSGEVVAIVGPSGCGKSTLLSILGGLLRPSAGVAEWRGAPPAGSLNPLTFVFQDFALLPWCTVEANVAFPLEHTALDAAARRAVIDAKSLVDETLLLQPFDLVADILHIQLAVGIDIGAVAHDLLDRQVGVFGDDLKQRLCGVVDLGLAVLHGRQDHVVIFAVGAREGAEQLRHQRRIGQRLRRSEHRT